MEIKAEKMQNESELSNLIFSEQWKEAALKAFSLKKKRDLAFILNQMIKAEKSSEDPINSVLKSLEDFETQFKPSEKKRESKTVSS